MSEILSKSNLTPAGSRKILAGSRKILAESQYVSNTQSLFEAGRFSSYLDLPADLSRFWSFGSFAAGVCTCAAVLGCGDL